MLCPTGRIPPHKFSYRIGANRVNCMMIYINISFVVFQIISRFLAAYVPNIKARYALYHNLLLQIVIQAILMGISLPMPALSTSPMQLVRCAHSMAQAP